MDVNNPDSTMYVPREILVDNLRKMGSHVKVGGGLEASRFRVVKNSEGQQILKTNGLVRQVLLHPFYSGKSHQAKIEEFATKTVTQVKSTDREVFVEYPDLLVATQRYAQSVTNARKILDDTVAVATTQLSDLQVDLARGNLSHKDMHKIEKLEHKIAVMRSEAMRGLAELPKLSHTELSEAEGLELHQVEKMEAPVAQRRDKPVVDVEQRKPLFTSLLRFNYLVRRYPTDIGIDHEVEAGRIATSTHQERFLNLVGRTLRAVGFEAHQFERFRYGEGLSSAEKKQAAQASDAPMTITSKVNAIRETDPLPPPSSFWLGHATLQLGVPVRSKTDPTKITTLQVITDPVEGDLGGKLMYPRHTEFAKGMDEIPAPHVYLLSHNHLDHYSKPTIQKLLAQQPLMVVPKGDGWRYVGMGFKNVQELDWWEGAEVNFKQGSDVFSLKIEAIPARHWAGQGPCGGHSSTFLGYMLHHGDDKGPIYFAGDTAPLDYRKEAKADTVEEAKYRAECNNRSTKELEAETAHCMEEMLKAERGVKHAKKGPALEQAKVRLNEAKQRYEISAYTLEMKSLHLEYTAKAALAEAKANALIDDAGMQNVYLERATYYRSEAIQAKELAKTGGVSEYSHIDVLRKRRPAYYFAPGGPDDRRPDMATTHQSSAYGMQAHTEMMLQGIMDDLTTEQSQRGVVQKATDYIGGKQGIDKKEFLKRAEEKRTVYMHTMTFKLGNLKLFDTRNSVQSVLGALKGKEFNEGDPVKGVSDVNQRIDDELQSLAEKKFRMPEKVSESRKSKIEAKRNAFKLAKRDAVVRKVTREMDLSDKGLRSYEWDVVTALITKTHEWEFQPGEHLAPKELAELLEKTVIVPKIGSNISLGVPKEDLKEAGKLVF